MTIKPVNDGYRVPITEESNPRPEGRGTEEERSSRGDGWDNDSSRLNSDRLGLGDKEIYEFSESDTEWLQDSAPEDLKNENNSAENNDVYKENNVDTETPKKENLSGREYDLYEIKDIDQGLTIDGETNQERMEKGNAPYVIRDGKAVKVELHHHNQKDGGPLVELDSDTHKKNQDQLHPHKNKGDGRGEDPDWNSRRNEHWKNRAAQNEG